MKCKICNSESKHVFDAKVLNKYSIKYYHCAKCGFLQTEDPYWLEEAYEDSIAKADTGIMVRNISLSRKTATILYF